MIAAFAMLVALVAVALVLEPLFRAASGKPLAVPVPLFADSDDEEDPRLIRRDRALAALKEIEFDRATGKLSDDDFARMNARFTAEALEAIRAADTPADAPRTTHDAPASDEAVERLIAEARAERRSKKRFCLECGTPVTAGV